MNFLLSPELSEFGEILQKFFSTRINSSFLRKHLAEAPELSPAPGKEDQELWKELGTLGIFSAFIPEKYEGLGFGLLSASLITEQAGRSLIPLPLSETIALGAIPLLLAGSEPTKQKFLPKIGTGELSLTGAFSELYPISTPTAPLITATSLEGRYLLTGRLGLIPSVKNSQMVLVPALLNNKRALFVVELSKTLGSTLKHTQQETLDLLRPYSELHFIKTEAELVSLELSSSWEEILHSISLLFAAEMIGASEKVLEMTLEHVKTRTQFGKAIGSFQAVSHKLSDIYLQIESALSLLRFAAWSFDNDKQQFPKAAIALKGFVSEELPKVIQTALQVHGGIGFTHEYDLHLYLRRVRTLAALYGTAEDHFKCLGDLEIVSDLPR